MASFEFWFDFSCPYAYLASAQVEALAARTGAVLVPEPMLLGGVFRAVDAPQLPATTMSEAKARHNLQDMTRQAKRVGIPLNMPAGHPFRTVEALRVLLAVGEPFMPLAHAFYRAYWVDGRDIGTEEVVRAVLKEAGHDDNEVWAAIQEPAIKQELRDRTDRAIERGVFGAPGLVVKDELYWGSDRLDYVERALGGSPESSPLRPRVPVDFYFDYSSPFAYLASERADEVFGGSVRWKPMLLGAVFKMVDMHNVPLFAMSDAKRRYMGRDVERQAKHHGAPFAWPSRFPMNTVLALRVTLLSGALEDRARRGLIHALFRAYWAEDRDISDPEVVGAILEDHGHDAAAILAKTKELEVKDALRKATDEAVAAGVFGAPSFVVQADEPQLYWGSDRIEWAGEAATSGAEPD